MKKLNLGCGKDIKSDCINLDCASLPGVDKIHNIENLPLPFKKNDFDVIYCFNILEHIDYIPVMRDIHRILKDNGILHIRVPHFTSRANYMDPTHKKRFSFETFYFFTKNFRYGREYYFDFIFERVVLSKIYFNKRLPYNLFAEPLVNISDRTKTIYEATFLSRLFPAVDLEVILQK